MGARGVSVALLSWAEPGEFIGAREFGWGAGPLGELVGVFVVPPRSVSEEERESGEDAEGEDVESDDELGALEELPEESELRRVCVRREAMSAHSGQKSPCCDATSTMHRS